MIQPNFKLVIKGSNTMLNFVEGYRATLGLGPIYWTYWVHDKDKDRSEWRKEEILDELVEKIPFIGIYDDTTWGQLNQEEMDFWIAKGYSFDNWKGKPIFVHDVVKCVCDGKEDKLEVISICHLFCGKNKDSCLIEFPCDRTKCKMYVLGNVIQDKELVEDFKN